MSSTNSLSRRRFLKSAALAGAVPFILPSRVWAADTAPSRQVTLGFIGLGKQGAGLLRACLPREDVRVLALCDVDTVRRKLARTALEKEYTKSGSAPACDEYTDFRELLARKDIDAVVIATPDHWHALIAIAAAKAGKDIYCEKPMAHTVLEGRAMVKAVRQNGRVFQNGSMQRSMGEFRAACELIRNGVIGEISHADAAVSGGPPRFCDLPAEPVEPGLDWNFWLGPAPERPYNSILSPRGMQANGFPQWRQYREYGGGKVADWGAHHFDIVQWAGGYDDSGPVEFFPTTDPANQSGVSWRYANGLKVTHLSSGNGITFFGSKGKIFVTRGKFKLWLGDRVKAETMDSYEPLLKELLPKEAVRLYRSTNQISDWVKCIHSRQKPVCDVETGQRSATICNLVNAVYFSGKGFKWNPRTESFADDTGNPAWLTREYREPWTLA